MKKITLLLISQLFLNTLLFAQDGALDPDFGEGGIADIQEYHSILAIGLQQDKILATGIQESTAAIPVPHGIIARYYNSGQLDETFGTNGYLTLTLGNEQTFLYDIAVLNDDSFIVAGYTFGTNISPSLFLAKFNANGTPFINFGTNGITTIENAGVKAIQVLPEGTIYVAGQTEGEDGDLAVFCFHADGSLDTSFGDSGIASVDAFNGSFDTRTLKIDGNKRIVVGGAIQRFGPINFDIAIARYNPDGTPDVSFGNNGLKITAVTTTSLEEIYTLEILPDNKIIAAGQFDGDIAVFQFNENGTFDVNYGNNGVSVIPFGNNIWSKSFDMQLQPDGKPVIVGFLTDYNNQSSDYNHSTIVRLTTSGGPDSTFGNNGIVITPIGNDIADSFSSMCIQPDNAILAGSMGSGSTALVRYLAGESLGVLDFSDKAITSYVYPNPVTSNSVLEYTLPSDEHVTIELFDLSGKKVKTLLSNTTQPAGSYRQQLLLPSELSSGTYFVVLSTPNGKANVKIIK